MKILRCHGSRKDMNMDDLKQPVGPPPKKEIPLPDLDFAHLTLDWAQYRDKWERSPDGRYYALRFVYYAARVVSPAHQYMNIYVPAAYLHPDGTVNAAGTCHGYTAKTAPIVMYNNCGGWMSSVPGDVNLDYIQNGFVHVNVGARSRDAGSVGKAPAACVDQKAAVRMLRLHDLEIPGDKEKIISCGGSGGGQMSSILGATGNMAAYYPALKEMGAAGMDLRPDGVCVSTIPDHIFASQCFCPIADIDHADLAYAWQRYDDPNITFSGFGIPEPQELCPFKLALQADLAQAFAGYVNGLGLKNQAGEPLYFPKNPDGTYALRSGPYYQAMLRSISDALNAWLRDKVQPDGSLTFDRAIGFADKETLHFDSVADYLASLKNADQWLTQDQGVYRVTDLQGFCIGTGLARGKDVPGFDTFHCTAENNAFGAPAESGVHFSAANGQVLAENQARYAQLAGYADCDVAAYIQQSQREDLKQQAYLMNATRILLGVAAGRVQAQPSKFWRTRNGTADEHTSFCIAYNLCLAAQAAGAQVDYALIWNAPHGDVDGDGTGTFAQWVHKICNPETDNT
jgi:hypothetical protein